MTPPQQSRPTRTCVTKNVKNVDQLDHAIIAEPLNLGIKNVAQIAACLDEGTAEVKDLLLNECNIIYECRQCTNLFRSLANFIAHKRIYCKDHYCEKMVLYDPSWFERNGQKASKEVIDETNSNSGDSLADQEENLQASIMTSAKPSTSSRSQLSPRKNRNPVRSTVIPSNSFEKSNNKTSQSKRKSLESIVKNLAQQEQSGISTEQFYTKKASQNRQTILANNYYENEVDDDEEEDGPSASKKQKKSREFLFLQNGTQKKKPSTTSAKHNYKYVILELKAEAEQAKLSNTASTPNSILLSEQSLNKLNVCENFLFECPDCNITCSFFSSAVRHLIKAHNLYRTRAKWLSFVNSRVANPSDDGPHQQIVSEEDAQNEYQSPTTSIVKVNNKKDKTIPNSEAAVAGSSSSRNSIADDDNLKLNSDSDFIALDQSSGSSELNVNGSSQNGTLKRLSEESNAATRTSNTHNGIVAKRINQSKRPSISNRPLHKKRTVQHFSMVRDVLQQRIHSKDQAAHPSQKYITITENFFMPLYHCIGFIFRCPEPKCTCTETSYANAVGHLAIMHNVDQLTAKLIAFQNGYVAEELQNKWHKSQLEGNETNVATASNGFSLDTSINQQSQPATVSTNGNSDNREVITLSDDDDVMIIEDENTTIEFSTENEFKDNLQPNIYTCDMKQNSNDFFVIVSNEEELSTEIGRGSFIPCEGAHFQLTNEMNNTFNMHAKLDPLCCRHCSSKKFLDAASLLHHIALKHCSQMVICCKVCQVYSTVHINYMQDHLYNQHNITLDFNKKPDDYDEFGRRISAFLSDEDINHHTNSNLTNGNGIVNGSEHASTSGYRPSRHKH